MTVSKDLDAELAALDIAVEAFNRVDKETAKRMIAYLDRRFVIDAPVKKP